MSGAGPGAAGVFWRRVAAWLVDGLIFLPVVFLGVWNVWRVHSLALLVALVAVQVFYKPMMEGVWGATLGKMALGLTVVREGTGERIGLGLGWLRALPFMVVQLVHGVNWGMTVATVEYPFALDTAECVLNGALVAGCLVAAATGGGRAAHDYLAGTRVGLARRGAGHEISGT